MKKDITKKDTDTISIEDEFPVDGDIKSKLDWHRRLMEKENDIIYETISPSFPSIEDIYGERIYLAKQQGGFYHAAELLKSAATFIHKGALIPKPLAGYIADVLEQTGDLSQRKKVDQRDSKIVEALNLRIVYSPSKLEDPRDREGAELRRNILKYMYTRIEKDGVRPGAAAKEAAQKFPFKDHAEKRGRKESAHLKLYERADKEYIEGLLSMACLSKYM